jgi:hypothetical protein
MHIAACWLVHRKSWVKSSALGGWGRVGAFAHLRLAVHLSVRVPTQMTLGSRPSGHIAWHVFADWIGWIVIESWILDGTWSDMIGHDRTWWDMMGHLISHISQIISQILQLTCWKTRQATAFGGAGRSTLRTLGK